MTDPVFVGLLAAVAVLQLVLIVSIIDMNKLAIRFMVSLEAYHEELVKLQRDLDEIREGDDEEDRGVDSGGGGLIDEALEKLDGPDREWIII